MAVITTVRSIAEQIARIYVKSTDRENIKPNMERQEIIPLVLQLCNQFLAIKPIDRYGGLHTDNISSLSIATYTGISVTQDGTHYTATLPVRPVHLPHDIGVWEIYPDGKFISPYIPVPLSLWGVMGDIEEVDLDDQIGFWVEGNKVYFTRNPNVSTVKIKLLVVDPNQLADTDPLPVPKDMEVEIIKEALKILLASGLPQPEDDNPERIVPQQTNTE
jgi:hypothetical protein